MIQKSCEAFNPVCLNVGLMKASEGIYPVKGKEKVGVGKCRNLIEIKNQLG